MHEGLGILLASGFTVFGTLLHTKPLGPSRIRTFGWSASSARDRAITPKTTPIPAALAARLGEIDQLEIHPPYMVSLPVIGGRSEHRPHIWTKRP